MTSPPRLGDFGPDDEALRAEIDEELEALAEWQPADLGPVLAGEVEERRPTILRFDDDPLGLFYPGAVNGLHGDSGIGKSWAALQAAAEVMADGRAVLLLDYEANVSEAVGRLRQLGAPTLVLAHRLLYVAPTSVASRAALDSLVALVAEHSVGLVVLDSLGEAFGVEAVDENKDAEVGPWLRKVPRRLAEAGPAVVIVDHSTKAADNPLHPSGSKRKRAAITGSSFYVSTEIPVTKEQSGRLYLACAKDRHGTYRRGREPVAVLDLQPYPDGSMVAHLVRPSVTERGEDAGVEALVRAVVRAAIVAGQPLSKNALAESDNMKGTKGKRLAAVELAAARGYLSVESGPNRSQLYSILREPEEAPEPGGTYRYAGGTRTGQSDGGTTGTRYTPLGVYRSYHSLTEDEEVKREEVRVPADSTPNPPEGESMPRAIPAGAPNGQTPEPAHGSVDWPW